MTTIHTIQLQQYTRPTNNNYTLPLNRRLGGSQIWSRQLGEEKTPFSCDLNPEHYTNMEINYMQALHVHAPML